MVCDHDHRIVWPMVDNHQKPLNTMVGGPNFLNFYHCSSLEQEKTAISKQRAMQCAKEEGWVSWVRAKVSWLPAFLIHLCPPPPFTASSSFSFSSSSSFSTYFCSSSFSSYFCSSSTFHSSSLFSSSSPHLHSPTPHHPHPERFFWARNCPFASSWI